MDKKTVESIKLSSFDDNFKLTKYVSSIIDTTEGREILIDILDKFDEVNIQAKIIWNDLLERAGFYPYFENDETSLSQEMRANYHHSFNLSNITFHLEQKEIQEELEDGKNVLVSAPTSFGKSLLIEEIVASGKYKNIIIIQPTLALIDETRRKLSKYNSYKLIFNLSQAEFIEEKNIFVLTPERILEIENLPSIDFLIVDEFYKINARNRDKQDDRVDALNISIYKLLRDKLQMLLLTPNIDSISEEFKSKYNIEFYNTDYSLVNNEIIEVSYEKKNKQEKLFEMLYEQEEPSLIYTKSHNEAYKLAQGYLKFLKIKNQEIQNRDMPLLGWIQENISQNWEFLEMLSFGIGIHSGQFPRHMVNSQLEYFQDKKLRVLFVTTSLIEGVNTVAKNMFIYDNKKGKLNFNYFDFANIKGRAGRMLQYYVGKVYVFEKIPEKSNFDLEVPVIDQREISDETLINIKQQDIKDNKKDEYQELCSDLPLELIDIFKSNLINIKGQKKLYYYLKENIINKPELFWIGVPNYLQLSKTLYLGYHFLAGQKEGTSTGNYKATIALKLVNSRTLKVVIKDQLEYNPKKGETETIKEILSFQKRDAKYEIPKFLKTIESIVLYLLNDEDKQKVNYSMFASLLENENIVDERLTFLLDFGLPSNTIRNLSVPKDMLINEVQRYVKREAMNFPNLTDYERDLLKNI